MEIKLIKVCILISSLIDIGIVVILIIFYKKIFKEKYIDLNKETNELIQIIVKLNKEKKEGNIKFLENKKEWLEEKYEILIKHKHSVFQVKQDINKTENQIKKLKS